MKPHHEAWLAAHPNRRKRWLIAQIKEGFDVHHLDGNHENNQSENLVLIEHGDHWMLHSGSATRTLGRMRPRKLGPRKSPKFSKKTAMKAYEKTRTRVIALVIEDSNGE